VRFEKETFGRALRAGRERRKVPLAQIIEKTKVSPELWRALEEDDLSRWPTRIYARSLIRQYAEEVGLDPEELVNEFCRLFPHGDRRADTLLRGHAGLVGHDLDWRSDPVGGEPPKRRAADHARACSTSASCCRSRTQRPPRSRSTRGNRSHCSGSLTTRPAWRWRDDQPERCSATG
jgi:hypothetical protein